MEPKIKQVNTKKGELRIKPFPDTKTRFNRIAVEILIRIAVCKPYLQYA